MRKALVVIDMQMGFMNENTEHLVDAIANYIDTFRDEFFSILGTAYINDEYTACYKFEGFDKCMENTAESYIVPKIRSRINFVIEKRKYSCWTEQLKDWVATNKVDKLYFVGVNTGCCVLHSAFDAYNDVVDCCVLEDLCGSTRGIESHKAAIQVLKECITEERVIKSSSEFDSILEEALKSVTLDEVISHGECIKETKTDYIEQLHDADSSGGVWKEAQIWRYNEKYYIVVYKCRNFPLSKKECIKFDVIR